MQEFENFGENI